MSYPRGGWSWLQRGSRWLQRQWWPPRHPTRGETPLGTMSGQGATSCSHAGAACPVVRQQTRAAHWWVQRVFRPKSGWACQRAGRSRSQRSELPPKSGSEKRTTLHVNVLLCLNPKIACVEGRLRRGCPWAVPAYAAPQCLSLLHSGATLESCYDQIPAAVRSAILPLYLQWHNFSKAAKCQRWLYRKYCKA